MQHWDDFTETDKATLAARDLSIAEKARFMNLSEADVLKACHRKGFKSRGLRSKSCPETIAKDGRRIRVYRAIVENSLRRRLQPDEEVHHINGNHKDNRSENLVVVTHEEHEQIHARKIPRVREL